tara:strand:+ start:10676 stop:10840 length:165 start_codon:yes stop_codon:yes gene_type:complete
MKNNKQDTKETAAIAPSRRARKPYSTRRLGRGRAIRACARHLFSWRPNTETEEV